MDINMREHPRKSYLDDCEEAPALLSSHNAKDTEEKKMLIIDLNGTMLFRPKRGTDGCVRPFARALLRYCLGPPDDIDGSTGLKHRSRPPRRSQGPYEVLVWSSASDYNVDGMVELLLPSHYSQRLGTNVNPMEEWEGLQDRLIGVWGRSTLAPNYRAHENVQVTKDLEIVWYRFNLDRLDRVSANQRAEEDRRRPDHAPTNDGHTPEEVGDRQSHSAASRNTVSAAQLAAEEATEAGPWGAQNSLILDDSVAKIHLHPFNGLLPLEYEKEHVKFVANLAQWVVQEDWARAQNTAQPHAPARGDCDSEYSQKARGPPPKDLIMMDLIPSSLRHVDKQQGALKSEGAATPNQPAETQESKEEEYERLVCAWDLVLRTDSSLLQVIGVLDAARHADHIGRWIRAGHHAGFPLSRANLLSPWPVAQQSPGSIRFNSGHPPRGGAGPPAQSSTEHVAEPHKESLARSLVDRLLAPASESMLDTFPRVQDDELFWIERGVRACAASGMRLSIYQDIFYTDNVGSRERVVPSRLRAR